MLDIILILAASAVIIFIVVAARQPTDFRITRTGTITAPASAVFPHVNDLPRCILGSRLIGLTQRFS